MAAGPALFVGIVAGMGERVVHSQPQALGNDLGLAQADERGVDLE